MFLLWKPCINGTHNERRSSVRVATGDRVLPFSGPAITPSLAKRGRTDEGELWFVPALRQELWI